MTAKLLFGLPVADDLNHRLAAHVKTLSVRPRLVVLRVGDDPASVIYVERKRASCITLGMESDVIHLPASCSEQELWQHINQLNNDVHTHGILVQLPLPQHINVSATLARISPDKDVDGIHASNLGRLVTGESGLISCTPQGCLRLLRYYDIPIAGQNVVVLGRSRIVGFPFSLLMSRLNATVTIMHSLSKDIPDVCRTADILAVAIGRGHHVPAEWIKPGATVIDVGINRITAPHGTTTLIGDVHPAAMSIAGAITPVPKGVGPMTVACLMYNTLLAYSLQNNLVLPATLSPDLS